MEVFGANNSGYTVRMFDFEKNFDADAFLSWMSVNWTGSFWYAAIYVALLFAGQRYMKNRPRFELRWALALWSGFLAIFSICGAARTLPELIHVIWHHGFVYSVCNPSYFYGPTAFWAYLFVISKVYELGDTFFIVLRKQPLILLHWYHHITVMIYVWYSYTDHTAPGRWFTAMNYLVHAFMYSYYTLRALQFRLPKYISVFITSMQITQMVMGLVVNFSSYHYKSQGIYCQQSYENMRYSLIMYCSYFVLFGYFFYTSYIQPKPVAALKNKTSESVKTKVVNGNYSYVMSDRSKIQ